MTSESSYQIISEDLQELTPIIIKLPPPFTNNAITLKDQVKELFKQMKRAFARNNREEALLNAFYIGQISEVLADTPTERAICRSVLTPYYQKVITKVYYIFELLGPSQIFRTKKMTLTHVYKLKTKEYRKLLDLTSDLAGAQLLEEEIDTRDLSAAQFTAPHI